MNDKKVFPIGKSIFWGQTAKGIFWIGAGFTGMFDNLLCNILSALFLLVGIISLIMFFRIDSVGNDADEMAEYNYVKAKANAGHILETTLCIAGIISILTFRFLTGLDLDWPRIVSQLFFVLMGIHSLSIGLSFRKLEAE